jgi:hypothetical protein
LNFGSTKVRRKTDADGHGPDDAGVDGGADDHLAGFDLLADVPGDAVEHLGEGPGHFRGPGHVDVEGPEELGVACEGFGELLAALDVGLELEDDLLEVGVGGLFGDAFEGLAEVDAGADHDSELGGEVQHVLLLGLAGVHLGDSGRETALGARGAGGGDGEDPEPLVAEDAGGGGDAVGGDDADLDFAGSGLDLVLVVRHNFVQAPLRDRSVARALRARGRVRGRTQAAS